MQHTDSKLDPYRRLPFDICRFIADYCYLYELSCAESPELIRAKNCAFYQMAFDYVADRATKDPTLCDVIMSMVNSWTYLLKVFEHHICDSNEKLKLAQFAGSSDFIIPTNLFHIFKEVNTIKYFLRKVKYI